MNQLDQFQLESCVCGDAAMAGQFGALLEGCWCCDSCSIFLNPIPRGIDTDLLSDKASTAVILESKDNDLAAEDCFDDCNCSCSRDRCAYGVDGMLTQAYFRRPVPIKECGTQCACPPALCANRVTSNVMKEEIDRILLVSSAGHKGSGVFARQPIKRGTFLCEYTGEIVTRDMALQRLTRRGPGKCNYVLIVRESFDGGGIEASQPCKTEDNLNDNSLFGPHPDCHLSNTVFVEESNLAPDLNKSRTISSGAPCSINAKKDVPDLFVQNTEISDDINGKGCTRSSCNHLTTVPLHGSPKRSRIDGDGKTVGFSGESGPCSELNDHDKNYSDGLEDQQPDPNNQPLIKLNLNNMAAPEPVRIRLPSDCEDSGVDCLSQNGVGISVETDRDASVSPVPLSSKFIDNKNFTIDSGGSSNIESSEGEVVGDCSSQEHIIAIPAPLSPIVTYVDATSKGNIGRFINHSCDPNVIVVPVRVDRMVPKLCFFAARKIDKWEELGYDYGENGNHVVHAGNFKGGAGKALDDKLPFCNDADSCFGGQMTECHCGAAACRRWLPSEICL